MVTGTRMRVAVLQLLVGPDTAANVRRACERIREEARRGAKLVVLPECFNSPYGLKHFEGHAEPIPGPTIDALREVARESSVFLIAGSIPERDSGKIYNTTAVIDDRGDICAKYRKMHLFDIDIPGRIAFRESAVISPGIEPAAFDVGDGVRVGLGICFDLRFAELSLEYARMGCNVLVYPSAFTDATGPKYWRPLQLARALDAQSFVITCSPAASAHGDFVPYGHSMIVGPDGAVLAEVDGSHEEALLHNLDLDMIVQERAAIPIMKSRRIFFNKEF